MTSAATLKPRGRKMVWSCPTCGKTLGEVYDGLVVVKADDRIITFPMDAPVNQTCPKCAEVSVIAEKEQVA